MHSFQHQTAHIYNIVHVLRRRSLYRFTNFWLLQVLVKPLPGSVPQTAALQSSRLAFVPDLTAPLVRLSKSCYQL